MNRRILLPLLALMGSFLPFLTQAATSSSSTAPFGSVALIVAKACYVVNILFTGALILTVVFVLLAAIRYITKGSDPKEVGTAHQMLIWAAIGFAVALFAAVFPSMVAGILGIPLPAGGC